MDNENNRSVSFATKAKDYYQLIKFTLSFTVVFSCVVCYLLAPNVKAFDWWMIAILFLAGMLVTGSANAINQAVEKDMYNLDQPQNSYVNSCTQLSQKSYFHDRKLMCPNESYLLGTQ